MEGGHAAPSGKLYSRKITNAQEPHGPQLQAVNCAVRTEIPWGHLGGTKDSLPFLSVT